MNRVRFVIPSLIVVACASFAALPAAAEPPECETKRATIRAGEMMCNDFKNAQACMLLEQERRASASLGCEGGSPSTAGTSTRSSGVPSGVIGDPAMASRERVYDDQCVRKIPRTELERAQCQSLYRAINPATNSGSSRPSTGRDSTSSARQVDVGNPVDNQGRDCVTPQNESAEQWGQGNITRRYFFRNGCNVAMQVDVQFAQHDGSSQGGGKLICPGRTEGLPCSGFSGNKGCSHMLGYRVRPSPESRSYCER